MEEHSQIERLQVLAELQDCFAVLRSLDPVIQKDEILRLLGMIRDLYRELDGLN